MNEELRQLTLVKKNQYYLFRYKAGNEGLMLQTLTELADDPKHPLDWFDAAILSHQVGHRIGSELSSLMGEKPED